VTAGAPSVGVGSAADDVDDADAAESVLEAVLVGEAVMVESVAVAVELAVAVAEALTLSVVALASDVVVAEAELAVEDAETESVAVEDAETESVAVAVDVGTALSDARVVVAEMETRVLTVEEAEADLSGLLALKARASSGVSRMVIFSTTVVVSLMLVAGSRFS